jgi:hypothetical protein
MLVSQAMRTGFPLLLLLSLHAAEPSSRMMERRWQNDGAEMGRPPAYGEVHDACGHARRPLWLASHHLESGARTRCHFRAEPRKDEGLKDPPSFKPASHAVNMTNQNYRHEPNVSFPPDQKWAVFRSNRFGPVYFFAVEVAK